MKVEADAAETKVVEAPEWPTILEIRMIVRLFRRCGMKADLHRCHPNEKGMASQRVGSPIVVRPDDPYGYRTVEGPPFAWVFATERAEHERIVEETYPYALVPDLEELWEAVERMGFHVSVNTHGGWTDPSYQVDVWHPDADKMPCVEGNGKTRQSAMFAAAYGVERITRAWRYGCGRGGLSRPWPWRKDPSVM